MCVFLFLFLFFVKCEKIDRKVVREEEGIGNEGEYNNLSLLSIYPKYNSCSLELKF